MKFRQYTFKCNDTNGNYLFDMKMTIPVYTVDEYNNFISEYNSKYANGDNIIIYGKNTDALEGSLTEYGKFLLNNMGFKYEVMPFTTPYESNYNKTWENLILKHFSGLYDISNYVNTVPVSSTDDTFIKRNFNIVNQNGDSILAHFTTYKDESYKYWPQYWSTNEVPQNINGSYFGSVVGNNTDNSTFSTLWIIFMVENNTISQSYFSGYYNYDPKNLTGKLGGAVTADSNGFKFLISSDYDEVDPTDNDPYQNGGNSGTGGGTGNFDGTSENIEIPGLPTLSAVDTGFITLFNPSAVELKNLASYMWGDVFDVSAWKKIFADPMDAILGLSIVPVNVPSAGSANVTIGNISTGVSMTKASSQYVSVDCGTINVNEYWGAYLDYSPYTKAEIYLPFIGTHPVTIDDIMGKPVHVVYHIDVLSGACCAYVQCDGTVLYSFVGQCSCSIPITANDWTNVINGALSIAGSIGTMVATGGATAPMAVTNIASTAVNSLKPDVEKSGSMGGMGGMLGVQKPYIILTRPRQALPARQNTFTGYPSFITKTLSECSGYTEVESIHLENVPATQTELDEITELLKSGVII